MCLNRQIYWDKPSAVALIPQFFRAYSRVWVYFTKITFGWGLFEGGGGGVFEGKSLFKDLRYLI